MVSLFGIDMDEIKREAASVEDFNSRDFFKACFYYLDSYTN